MKRESEARQFLTRHRWDGYFWAVFLILGAVSVVAGFSDPVVRRFTGKADYDAWPLVVHVWTVCAWLFLLPIQAWLIAIRRHNLHRLLGQSLPYIALLVVISGFWAESISQKFHAADLPDHVRFLVVPILQMGGFGVFTTLAWSFRDELAAHKRFIFLATASLLSASIGRAWGEAVEALLNGLPPLLFDFVAFHFGFLLLVSTAIAYDWLTRARVHAALLHGMAWMALAMFVATFISLTDWWPIFARALLGI